MALKVALFAFSAVVDVAAGASFTPGRAVVTLFLVSVVVLSVLALACFDGKVVILAVGTVLGISVATISTGINVAKAALISIYSRIDFIPRVAVSTGVTESGIVGLRTVR